MARTLIKKYKFKVIYLPRTSPCNTGPPLWKGIAFQGYQVYVTQTIVPVVIVILNSHLHTPAHSSINPSIYLSMIHPSSINPHSHPCMHPSIYCIVVADLFNSTPSFINKFQCLSTDWEKEQIIKRMYPN